MLRATLTLMLTTGLLFSQQEPREEKGLEGFGIDPADVNRAIERGSTYLWQMLLDGELQGNPALLGNREEHLIAALALVHAGMHEREPLCDAAIRGLIEGSRVRARTYELAVLAMLVDAYDDQELLALLPRLARSLVESQGEDGSWTYNTPDFWLDPSRHSEPKLEAEQRWSLLSSGGTGNGDNSCAQFAVLGMRAAERHGHALPAVTWQRVRQLFSARQQADGGWGYKDDASYGSMSCAGICSLAIADWALAEAAGQAARDRALSWLDARLDVHEHTGSPGLWHYYYLYSIERVGQLLGSPFIGSHEWYPLGVGWLLGEQGGDGRWQGEGPEEDPVLATSFALLFLTRATETLAEPEPRTGSLLTVPVFPFEVLDQEGNQVAAGIVGETVELPKGWYTVKVHHGSQVFVRELQVDGRLNTIEFAPGGGD